jgi:hypothetical protein
MRRNQTDLWFVELLKPLQNIAPGNLHPSQAILHAYVKGRLPDMWRTGDRSPNPDDWTLTEVSQHALACQACGRQLAQMRRVELERTVVWAESLNRIPGAIRTHVALYAIILSVLFLLNGVLLWIFPPVVPSPCNPASPQAAAGSHQTVDQRLKIEGVNKPVGLPSACPPAPTPQPWQTWWAPWIFIFWTPLLGLHVLWSWFTEMELDRRHRTAATTFARLAPTGPCKPLFVPVFR